LSAKWVLGVSLAIIGAMIVGLIVCLTSFSPVVNNKKKAKINVSYNLLVEVQARNKKIIVNGKTRLRFATYGKWLV
jgi:hypothetical protein